MDTTPYLNDEHMRLYEWNGAGRWMQPSLPRCGRRVRPWHAALASLSLLTTVLLLNACDRNGPAKTADEQMAQAVKQMKEELSIGQLQTGTDLSANLDSPRRTPRSAP